jgi:hypothetical protein
LVLDGSWFEYIYTGSKAVTLICVLYIRILLIKGLRSLGYRSSLSLQAKVFNGNGKVWSKYPRVNTLNLSVEFGRKGGINYYREPL